jgi:hypothetical protein
MIQRFTRWVDRRFVAEDYSAAHHSGVGFVSCLPLLAGVISLDYIPSHFAPIVLSVTGVTSAAVAGWAFWRWFKGASKTQRSQRQARYARSYGQDSNG